ncbi:MerR family transcriptional regulator [Nocardiopsis terrae]|uniref:DNA-binding transcriptional MerR regulator n=1 Tax=Nocardiopsis terrae TaxID=372655 RepID=A0ABR9HKI5_9ACTN|nr:TioE family transcriptional regulator [Nocardiopsis terrae]MBE1459539.1 DNA-binding transcriptional MerR regulator [Nocardiopsis terrae]GHC95148.1 MerR family transcriptional regulator [Nocardiopsis terrae]
MRPSDLAREHGLSAQAVRNYERDGFIPPAERTSSGYRVYTEVHAAALRAYLALVAAFGYAYGGRIMHAVHEGDLDHAFTVIDHGHGRLLRDRQTLDAVREAVGHLTATAREQEPAPGAGSAPGAEGSAAPGRPGAPGLRTIGELAHRLDVTPATLRNWEEAGILTPVRDPETGYRGFGANDVRDADLAHLLRRGGYPLEHIATVVHQIRTAGGTDELAGALDGWQRKLTARGRAMLTAATRLDVYLNTVGPAPYR